MIDKIITDATAIASDVEYRRAASARQKIGKAVKTKTAMMNSAALHTLVGPIRRHRLVR